jgi:23S rRNA pseudouridine2605 synthase
MALERLQKYLAASGVTSRRRAEELIVAGRVVVNGKVVSELGSKIDPEIDLVVVDGKPVLRNDARAYYLLYKPPGCVTTASDPQGRPKAIDYLHDVHERVFAVGRLDYDAEGAILFTDDGELANRLAHPRYGHARTYLAKIRGEPSQAALDRMKLGVRLEDGPAKALEVVVHEKTEKNTWVRIVVGEGRFHLVKRLCEAVGLQIQRLYRPEFGGVTVEGLRAGEYRALTPNEVKAMKALVGLVAAGKEVPQRPIGKLPRAARRHGHGPPAADPDAEPYVRPAAKDAQPDGDEAEPSGEAPSPTSVQPRRDDRSSRTSSAKREQPRRDDRSGRPPSARRDSPRRDDRPGGAPSARRDSPRRDDRSGGAPSARRDSPRREDRFGGAHPDKRVRPPGREDRTNRPPTRKGPAAREDRAGRTPPRKGPPGGRGGKSGPPRGGEPRRGPRGRG